MTSGKPNLERVASSLSTSKAVSDIFTRSNLISFIIVAGCSLFVISTMNPRLILSDAVPTGGDMGAHVWGPAYLRDELLPNWRLSGWSPDWYAGFPAYQFYMVVPALAVVALNVGLDPLISVPAAVLAAAAIFKAGRLVGLRRRHIIMLSVAAVVLLIPLPYGTAFKLISVVGLVFFPVSAWFLGRMAKAPQPVPEFLALGATVFLFDASFWILGGNIMSTLAGEFSFSISLTLAFFAMGLVFKGMDSQGLRGRSAVVIALVALCHIIPMFFMVIMLAFILLLGRSPNRYPVVALASVISALLFVSGPNTASVGSFFDGSVGVNAASWSTFGAIAVIVFGTLLVGFAVVQSTELRQRAWWLITTGGVGALIAMFWLLPFLFGESHFNDMGWTRLVEIGPKILTPPMKIALPIAGIGSLTSFINRDRIGMLFTASAAVSLSAIANLPQGALWNERILPFLFLSVYLLTGFAVASWVRAIAIWKDRNFDQPNSWVMGAGSLVGFAILLIGLSMPLRTLPFGQLQADGSYTWGVFKSTEETKVPGWSSWNYSGYEGRTSYAEYHHVVNTMDELGQTVGADGTDGCGRAMWEFDDSLDRYGTPMALMLLPHWTDGCISSMEGLFFESSATTPFHFLNQSTLSQEPSRAQRDLPYSNFDIDVGVAQLQTMGVRYYMALTDSSIEAARAHEDLTEVADAAPFVVFEVSGSELVESLAYDPVVINDSETVTAENVTAENATAETVAAEDVEPVELTRFDTGWLSQAVEYYGDPSGFDVLPAEEGPTDWQESDSLAVADPTPRDPVTVSNIEMGQSSISFDVDEVNSPVLVKVSHFPNWEVAGAEGPFRAGPNLMVVIPTSENVSLTYGRSAVDWISILLTLAGLAGVYALVRLDGARRLVAMAGSNHPEGPGPGWGGLGEVLYRLSLTDDGARTSEEPTLDPLPGEVSAVVGLSSGERSDEVVEANSGERSDGASAVVEASSGEASDGASAVVEASSGEASAVVEASSGAVSTLSSESGVGIEKIVTTTEEHCGEGWEELGGFCGGEDDEEDDDEDEYEMENGTAPSGSPSIQVGQLDDQVDERSGESGQGT